MNRVVITGMGIIAPNAHGLEDFEQALRQGDAGQADMTGHAQEAVYRRTTELLRDFFGIAGTAAQITA